MKITVKIRDVYGKEAVCPACQKSLAFARIANSKTLTERALTEIRALGYEVEVASRWKNLG
jgi:hypothetical protein